MHASSIQSAKIRAGLDIRWRLRKTILVSIIRKGVVREGGTVFMTVSSELNEGESTCAVMP